MVDLVRMAKTLDKAALGARAVPQPSAKIEYTVEDAYEVQKLSIERRIKRGERRNGMKMGFTSRAKMAQMGIEDMIWGRLTDAMVIEDGGSISLDRYVHPRVEPEIAFLLRRPLHYPCTAAEALAAVDGVAAAMEIIDSRYSKFKFSLEDVIADNASSSGFVIGPWRSPDIELENLGMVLEFDGRARQIGSSAAILGHPVRSLVAAARLSAEAGESLKAGWIVMAGGATAAEPLAVGVHVRNTVQNLGAAAFSVTA